MTVLNTYNHIRLVQYEDGSYAVLDHEVEVFPATNDRSLAIRQFKYMAED